MTPEILLSYANGRWRARGLGADLEHADLRSLESLIETQLADSGEPCVAVRFDVSSLPPWLRQYQSHYFNYRLRLAPPGNDRLRLAPTPPI